MTGGDTRAFTKTWGCEPDGDGKLRFRLWAPAEESLTLRLRGADIAMDAAESGWFETTATAADGDAYSFVLPDGFEFPDPASRAQQGDVHGPSLVVDPAKFRWRNTDWQGRPLEELVIYELHVGTFTPGGTFRAAIERLGHLAQTGVTAVEIMPVAQFAGNRGWGYDGVLPYAPHPAYGSPDDMKAFIDAAHGHGLMVLLDVVYNHFGPEGNYLGRYAPDFFDERRHTPWGAAIAYEKPPVRRFFIENALYWLEEFHLDGLRLDAIDNIRDKGSSPELLVELARTVREQITDRPIHLTTEDNRNVAYLHERGDDGSVPLYSAEWNDDFHNAAHVLATGETDGYYGGFADKPLQQLARCLAEGFAYQGDALDGEPRGQPSTHLPPTAFVDFLQNHDQTGNRAYGERLLTLAEPQMMKALAAIMLLSPHIPMLFMGEEYGETRPFCFFTDFDGELADAVREGRRKEFAHFGSFQGHPEELKTIPDPNALETFQMSSLDWAHAKSADGRAWLAYTTSLLDLRRRLIVPLLAGAGGESGSVVRAEDGVIAVDWKFDAGTLQMRANLGPQATACPPVAGDIVFPAGTGTRSDLAPCTVVVALAEAGKGKRPSPIDELARRQGISLTLQRLDGVEKPVTEDTKRHVLKSLGLGIDTDAEIESALERSRSLTPPELKAPGDARCHLPDWLEKGRAWGVSLQLYELRSARNWGIGDFDDLGEAAEICADAGADFVGLNPLHALFLADPDRCSPFSPSNRRFLNPVYIAIDKLPGFTADITDDEALAGLRAEPLVNYSGVVQAKLAALRTLWQHWRDAEDLPDVYSHEAFETFRARGDEPLRLHAVFEALSAAMVEQGHGAGWHGWPEKYRDKNSPEVVDFAGYNDEEIAFHVWLQWICSIQLNEAADRAKKAGMRIGLYFDLAVGEAPDGSASWSDPAVALPGLTIGAPPDFFTANGQDWGLAPASPQALAGNYARKFRSMMNAAMEGSGALRIDHVMALWQLFLVPEGKTPANGVYLRYPIADLLRVLAECSEEHETLVIGEDLGNVPPGFREVMQAVRVFSYRILYFEQNEKGFIAPDQYPELAMACLSTHDLPTLKGWWRGDDVALRREHGLIEVEAEQFQRAERYMQRKSFIRALKDTGALGNAAASTAADAAQDKSSDIPEAAIVAAHDYIAATPCLLAGVRLADLTGFTTPTNLPGTSTEYPNWRPRLDMAIEDLAAFPLFREIAATMRRRRPRR